MNGVENTIKTKQTKHHNTRKTKPYQITPTTPPTNKTPTPERVERKKNGEPSGVCQEMVNKAVEVMKKKGL